MTGLKRISKEDQRNLALILINFVTLVLYWPVSGFDFVNYDDAEYVLGNKSVAGGLTLSGLKWAATTGYASNWHPLTWISHMLDTQLFGMRAGLHHLTNVWFHIGNSVLLFLFLERVTARMWRSALVAMLFAWHPLHVESVAWVSERKDMLSVCFLLLCLLAYVKYCQKPHWSRYLLVAGLLAMSLMSKPMAVTVPFLLLLLDYWPLRRLRKATTPSEDSRLSGAGNIAVRRSLGSLILEKVPLCVISLASILITLHVQRGAMASFGSLSLPVRLGNALTAYGTYLWKTIAPVGLYVLHSIQETFNPILVLGISVPLFILTLGAIRFSTGRPWLAVGWFWFLGTLVPVIGLVQVGSQSLADRYTYFPIIGLFVAVVWQGAEYLSRNTRYLRPAIVGTAAILFAFVVITHFQLAHWRNSVTLWQRTVEHEPDNALARVYWGSALDESGRKEAAKVQFQIAEQIAPQEPTMHLRFGLFLEEVGQTNEALVHLEEAARGAPSLPETHFHLAQALARRGRNREAAIHYDATLKIDPENSEARSKQEELSRSLQP